MVKLVGHHSCGADRLPVAVRFPAGPRVLVRLKTVDLPKGNGGSDNDLTKAKRLDGKKQFLCCGRFSTLSHATARSVRKDPKTKTNITLHLQKA